VLPGNRHLVKRGDHRNPEGDTADTRGFFAQPET